MPEGCDRRGASNVAAKDRPRVAARNLLSRPPHRKRSEPGWASGNEEGGVHSLISFRCLAHRLFTRAKLFSPGSSGTIRVWVKPFAISSVPGTGSKVPSALSVSTS